MPNTTTTQMVQSADGETLRRCWVCRQPATHVISREGSNTLNACAHHASVDREEAEQRGWTVTPLTAMPNPTATVLDRAGRLIHLRGLHRGDQFTSSPLGRLDVCAAIYLAAHGGPVQPEFYTDEDASLRLIECSAPAMQAIRALSDALDTEPPTTRIADDHEVADYIEHVSNWAASAPIGQDFPPTTSEVIGRLFRTADSLRQTALAA